MKSLLSGNDRRGIAVTNEQRRLCFYYPHTNL